MRAAAGGATATAMRSVPVSSTVTVSPGRDDRRRLALLDDRRARECRAGAERVAVVDRRRRRKPSPNQAARLPLSAVPAAPAPACAMRQLRQPAAATHAQRHHLHRHALINRRVARRVSGREGGAGCRACAASRDASSRQRDIDFVHLAEQPHVRASVSTTMSVSRDAGGEQARARLLHQLIEHRIDRARPRPARRAASGWLRTCSKDKRGREEAQRRGCAGGRRDQHFLTPRMRATPAAWAGPAPPKPTMA